MEYLIYAAVILILPASCTSPSKLDFYSLTAKDIQGNEMSLEQYKGKVNVKCIVTTELQQLLQHLIQCLIAWMFCYK